VRRYCSQQPFRSVGCLSTPVRRCRTLFKQQRD
jgi:hypothetical protein